MLFACDDNVVAQVPILALPVDCDMGTVCTIHKYFDHDPGPGRLDYACGRLSLDGDTGADFRVPNYPVMREGVAVIAAADGVVRARRDGMADISVRKTGQAAVKDRFAGNAVVLTHADGWETQYSHLRKGSVRVEVGQRVMSGDVLGLIGLSGNTEFPHVEFTVRHNGQPVDPFVGERDSQPGAGNGPYQCTGERSPLWSEAAQAELDYSPTGVLSAGFAPEAANVEKARQGRYGQSLITRQSPAMVFWVDVFGAEQGDIQEFHLVGPDGAELVSGNTRLEKNNIAWFAFAGKKRPEAGWLVGPYRGVYRLERDGVVVAETEMTIIID